MSSVSREDNGVMSSEGSSSPEEAELELGLGLGLSGGFRFKGQRAALKGHPYARILTARDLPYVISSASSFSSSSSSTSSSSTMSSSSSSTLSRTNVTGAARTKRSADSVTAPNAPSSHVVGWPPIRSYRINSMVNQGKSLASGEFNPTTQKNNQSAMVGKTQNGSNTNEANAKVRTSLFVKVNMDGIAIGRKVDLNAYGCYEKLAQALEDMFLRPSTSTMATRSRAPEHNRMVDASRCSKLLDGSSEFVLTYEDKEGDWMLVGDVPWRIFLSSVKRLRIMGTREATGLGKQI